jgi:hypothetical protein
VTFVDRGAVLPANGVTFAVEVRFFRRTTRHQPQTHLLPAYDTAFAVVAPRPADDVIFVVSWRRPSCGRRYIRRRRAALSAHDLTFAVGVLIGRN